MDPKEVRRQMRDMVTHGMGGGFVHSREGLATEYLSPEWFKCVNAAIDEAKKVGGYAWLYDEDRWPSGGAGGLVTIEHPEYRQRVLEMLEYSPDEFSPNGDEIKVFKAQKQGSSAKNISQINSSAKEKLSGDYKILSFVSWTSEPSVWFNNGTYLDTLSRPAVRAFIDSTYEVYKKNCGNEFGKRVPGIFTDEPNFLTVSKPSKPKNGTFITWTNGLPDEFKKRYGYSLLDYLPYLFLDVPDDEDTMLRVRHDYWECVTGFFLNNFTRQIYDWCHQNKIMFTGHVLEEQAMASQIPVVGAAMRHYEYMHVPGIDILTESISEVLTVKQCSSACHQFGQNRLLSELYGCTGWDFTLEGQKWLADWQYALGVNFRCQHLSFYTMEGRAKRDYPASIFYQSPWWKYYSLLENYYTRLSFILSQGKAIQDILVIHPIESAWSVYNPDLPHKTKMLDKELSTTLTALLKNHYDFDMGDEDIMSRHAQVKNQELTVGKASYRAVIIPPMITLRKSTFELLKKFVGSNGKIIALYPYPERIDCKKSDELKAFLQSESVKLVANNESDFIGALRNSLPPLVSIKENRHYDEIDNIIYQLRKNDGQLMLFVVNTNRSVDSPAWITLETSRYYPGKICNVEELDATTGKIIPLYSTGQKGRIDFSAIITRSGSRTYLISPDIKKGKALPAIQPKVVSKIVLSDGFDFKRDEPNALTIDFCRYRMREKNKTQFSAWSETLPIWKAQQQIRKSLNLPEIHRNGGLQPWAAYHTPYDTGCRVELVSDFQVTHLPKGKTFIVIEKPEIFDIILNGKSISNKPQGWWVDNSFSKVEITSNLKTGKNVIYLSTDYHGEYDIEDMYLIGDFGVDHKIISIIKEPNQLNYGNWVLQGYPFYSGSITYFKDINIRKNKGERIFVNFNSPSATVVAIGINGKRAGLSAWPPYKIEVTKLLKDGRNRLSLEIVSSRRNLLGPLHNTGKPYWTSSYEFRKEQTWIDEYQFVPYGLTGEAEIITYGG
jgi:hypothetical protein